MSEETRQIAAIPTTYAPSFFKHTPVPTMMISMAQAGRELLRIDADGLLSLAPDLTLDEAKYLIYTLVGGGSEAH